MMTCYLVGKSTYDYNGDATKKPLFFAEVSEGSTLRSLFVEPKVYDLLDENIGKEYQILLKDVIVEAVDKKGQTSKKMYCQRTLGRCLEDKPTTKK